jgi:branched-chain amino acid transport system ATP-binding protein
VNASPAQAPAPAATSRETILDVRNVSKSFGGLKAVQSFTLHIKKGDLQGLIGPNGAGKTTCFNLLTGVYTPDEGAITLTGRSIAGARPFRIAQMGMARTFQNIRLFGELSVLDNVRIACHLRVGHTLAGAICRSVLQRAEERAMRDRAMELLTIFGLDTRREEQAKNLPYGDQRRLEIARALATEPRILLLDEPAAGMNPQEKLALRKLILQVRDQFHLAILLIEHDMGVVMNCCDHITVLNFGQTIATGCAEEVQNNPKVIEAYLGTE